MGGENPGPAVKKNRKGNSPEVEEIARKGNSGQIGTQNSGSARAKKSNTWDFPNRGSAVGKSTGRPGDRKLAIPLADSCNISFT